MAKGERGERGPTTVKNDLTRVRMFFLYVNEYLTEKQIKYRKVLKSPAKRQLREAANLRGPRMFDAKKICALVKAASPQLRAMIYLGINCGFGNNDCGTLPIDQIDLENGWHTYWRPKTHNPRRCPLWPETVKALKEAVAKRPRPASKEVGGLVFLTREGTCWSKEAGGNAISPEFRKLLKDLGIYRPHETFYSLRRTFETVAAVTGEQVAIDHIMGHIAPTNDMAAVYRQQVFDKPLLKVTNHVRAWLLGRKKVS
ncbi:MAG TPA: tyrosine-type recombinase/integrase [Pirellulales bacterium]|nr:tyrosine-type recombinase/integrase [Pirellulales bacterium]